MKILWIVFIFLAHFGRPDDSPHIDTDSVHRLTAPYPGTEDFGYSIYKLGNTLAVGSPNDRSCYPLEGWANDGPGPYDEGCVYIYSYHPENDPTHPEYDVHNAEYDPNDPETHTWALTQALTRPADEWGTYAWTLFGTSIVIPEHDPDMILIGATGTGGFEATVSGVYVFRRDPESFLFEYVFPSDLDAFPFSGTFIPYSDSITDIREFGRTLAVFDTTLVIGAPLTVTQGDYTNHHGAVDIYESSGNVDGIGWEHVQRLLPSDNGGEAYFGVTVAMAENIIAVGATSQDLERSSLEPKGYLENNGAVYVFSRADENSEWEEVTKLVPSDDAVDAWFGSSLSFSPNNEKLKLAVGAPNQAGQNQNLEEQVPGAVYVFEQETHSWNPNPVIFGCQQNCRVTKYGSNVRFSGNDDLVISAHGASIGGIVLDIGSSGVQRVFPSLDTSSGVGNPNNISQDLIQEIFVDDEFLVVSLPGVSNVEEYDNLAIYRLG